MKQDEFEKLKLENATFAVEIQAMKQIMDARMNEAKTQTDAGLRSVLAAEQAMERSVGWTRWTLGPFMALIGLLMAIFVGNLVLLSKDVSGLSKSLSALSEKVEKNDAAVSQQLVSLQRSIEHLDAKIGLQEKKK